MRLGITGVLDGHDDLLQVALAHPNHGLRTRLELTLKLNHPSRARQSRERASRWRGILRSLPARAHFAEDDEFRAAGRLLH